MVKNKNNELLVSNYIIQNTDLLFYNSISDIKIIEKGKVVELWLYYKPNSKYDVWKLRKEFLKEPQYIMATVKNGTLCAKFLAPSKFADLIICKLHANKITSSVKKILKYCETKNPGRS